MNEPSTQSNVAKATLPVTIVKKSELEKKSKRPMIPEPTDTMLMQQTTDISPGLYQPAFPQSRMPQTTAPQTSLSQPSMSQSGRSQPTMSQTSMSQPGMLQPNTLKPSMSQHGMLQPTMSQTSMSQPDMLQPTMFQPAMTQTSMFTPANTQTGVFQPMQQTQPGIPSRTSIMSSGRGARDSVLIDTNFTQGFLQTQIGRHVKVEFLIGTNMLIDREGLLVKAGTDYIIIQETETDDYLLCDMYSIKFIRFYY